MPPDAGPTVETPSAAREREGYAWKPAQRGQPRSLEERLAAGKALRDKLPRAQQGLWRRRDSKVDALALLRAGDEQRIQELLPIRYGRMLQSPFAFYRGSAAVMASDLGPGPTSGLRTQACGDCHLMNFGGFATPERQVLFDTNDFDETLPAPWEWDVKRLVASFVLAARSLGFSEAKGRGAAEDCAQSYRKHIREYAAMHPLDVWYSRNAAADFVDAVPENRRSQFKNRIEKSSKETDADFPRLTDVVGGRLAIRDAPPLIFHPDIALEPGFEGTVRRVLDAYRETLAEDRRALLDQYEPVDAALKVVGVGSVGRRCWIVLMMSASNDPLFLQLKEAVPSVLEPFAGPSIYRHHGQRVVMGQRLSQPASDLFLGWVSGDAGVHYYVRQLRDMKIKPLIETFDDEALTVYAEMCGWVLARAHSKAGEGPEIAGYLGASDVFGEAMGDFGLAYADQVERDYAALKSAVRRGDIAVFRET